MIRTELIDRFSDVDIDQLGPIAQAELNDLAGKLDLAFNRIECAWRLTLDDRLIMICCVFRGRGLIGVQPEIGVLGGQVLSELRKSHLLELRLHAKTLFRLYPNLIARLDADNQVQVRFAEFFGFRCKHARKPYSIYEAS